MSKYMTFNLRSEQYGFPIEAIREINRVAEITPVPKTPSFVRGVMNLRGKIIPVIDLRMKLGIEQKENTRDTCIVVIDTEMGIIGLVVDSVQEVVEIPSDQIQKTPHLGHKEDAAFVKGLGKIKDQVIILVDVEAAFSKEKLGDIMPVEPPVSIPEAQKAVA